MKILLIYPDCLDDRLEAEDVRVVPIGLYYIGALLKENHYDVEILNWHDINNTPKKIEETLKEKMPDVIGFSVVHANRWGGIDIAKIAKQILPEVKIVFGGMVLGRGDHGRILAVRRSRRWSPACPVVSERRRGPCRSW